MTIVCFRICTNINKENMLKHMQRQYKGVRIWVLLFQKDF